MKPLNCHVKNFGSYKDLNLSYENSGLCLIYGPTGSGKSTIPDMPAWVLFGQTAKDGNADDIRSWTATTDPTQGILTLEHSGSIVTITRTRGSSRGQNDLYYQVDAAAPIRGKDIPDTQKQLEIYLGVSRNTYFISSYYHEFSETANFFTANAKNRRLLFENLTDLSLADRLNTQAGEAKKETKSIIAEVEGQLQRAHGKIENLNAVIKNTERARDKWQEQHLKSIKEITARNVSFEADKAAKYQRLSQKERDFNEVLKHEVSALRKKMKDSAKTAERLSEFEEKVKALTDTASDCDLCGQPVHKNKTALKDALLKVSEAKQAAKDFNHGQTLLAVISERQNPHSAAIKALMAETNHHDKALEHLKSQENPHINEISDMMVDFSVLVEQQSLISTELGAEKDMLNALDRLQDFSVMLRSKLLTKAVAQVQEYTNKALETYFDGALKAYFTVDSDALTVFLTKDSHSCNYKQLSKGQQAMLKLCFSVGVMKIAANNAGQHFDTLFFDEALDGLDSDLKLRSYDLFSNLQKDHTNVFLIDHDPGFQTLFENKIKVILDNGHSEAGRE